MAPPRKNKKPTEQPPGVINLRDAVAFVNLATFNMVSEYQQYVLLANRYAIASDGLIALGHPITEDIAMIPQAAQFLAALERCGDGYAITQLADAISVQAGRFRASLPCLTLEAFPIIEPDPIAGNLTPDVIDALYTVAPCANPHSERAFASAILLRSMTAIATDGRKLFEAWHGVDLPPVTLPVACLTTLKKIKKVVTKFGFSQSSFTFWFEDNSWFKVRLYDLQYPSTDRLYVEGDQLPKVTIPPTLFEAFRAVLPFCDKKDKKVFLYRGKVATSTVDTVGAHYDIEGLPDCAICVNPELVLDVPSDVKLFSVTHDRIYWYGDTLRAITMGMQG